MFKWLKLAGPMTESEIHDEIYGFVRGCGYGSNKKYAECLRRLLITGKIGRRRGLKNVFEYFAAVPNFDTNTSSNEIKLEVKEMINMKPSLKSQLQNFDVV